MNNKRILIVEDEPLIALDLEQAVVDAGCSEAVCVSELGQALDIAAKDHFHAAILDLKISNGSTLDVARTLAARGTHFIFSTGDSNYIETLVDWPEGPVYLKPFSVDELVNTLGEMLKGPYPIAG